MSAFGPTFDNEIATAGLIGAPFAWNSDGTVSGRENLTDAQNAALDAVIAAHDPKKQPPPQIPQSVSRMQAMVALSRAGHLDKVQSWVAGQDAETQLIWSSAQNFNRGSALLGTAAKALDLTSDQIDALFIQAAAINP